MVWQKYVEHITTRSLKVALIKKTLFFQKEVAALIKEVNENIEIAQDRTFEITFSMLDEAVTSFIYSGQSRLQRQCYSGSSQEVKAS